MVRGEKGGAGAEQAAAAAAAAEGAKPGIRDERKL